MTNSSRIGAVLRAVLLLLSALLAVGSQFLFHACGPMKDGSYMNCHWAQQAVTGVGFVLAALAVLSLLAKKSAAQGAFAAAMIPPAILAAIIPNTLIPLCMMPDMTCRAVMRPAVLVISVLIIVLAAAAALVCRGQEA